MRAQGVGVHRQTMPQPQCTIRVTMVAQIADRAGGGHVVFLVEAEETLHFCCRRHSHGSAKARRHKPQPSRPASRSSNDATESGNVLSG